MNNALYYPTIEFQNYEWLWNAALLWDRIYRIVPSGYEPDDPENLRVLVETGEIGIALQPDAYTKDVAEEFLAKAKSGEWDAAALVSDDVDEEYVRLHEDKVDVRLRQMLIASGAASAREEWLSVPTHFESLYMTFLAEQMSQRNNLHLLTDFDAAWTASTYFKYNGQLVEQPWPETTQQLAVLVIRDFLPRNVLDLTPDQILKFRDKYREERKRFMSAIDRAAKDLSECEDEVVYADKLVDLKRDIEETLADYKSSLSDFKILGWTGLKSVGIPVVTKVASAIAGKELDPYTLSVVSTVGIGLGLVAGFTDFQEKKKKLEKDCDYSYLLHLARNWKGCALYERDFNFLLSRTMQEFISD